MNKDEPWREQGWLKICYKEMGTAFGRTSDTGGSYPSLNFFGDFLPVDT